MEKETSKVFKQMAIHVGIINPLKSHRGIIAKKYLEIIEDVELREFALTMPNLLRREVN